MIYYYDSNGRKYLGKLHICSVCGRQKTVRASKTHPLCRKCSYGRRKTDVKDSECFILEKLGRRTARVRAEKSICSICQREYLRRKNHGCKTKICNQCICNYNGKLSYKNGMGDYIEKATTHYGKFCQFCKSEINLHVHHIDLNRKNNELKNLLPLCHSCHLCVHWRIRKGMTCVDALKAVSAIKHKHFY